MLGFARERPDKHLNLFLTPFSKKRCRQILIACILIWWLSPVCLRLVHTSVVSVISIVIVVVSNVKTR